MLTFFLRKSEGGTQTLATIADLRGPALAPIDLSALTTALVAKAPLPLRRLTFSPLNISTFERR